MKVLCKLFGHRYDYYLTQDVEQRNFRVCKYCGRLQEYKTFPGLGYGWYSLVQRTKKGAVRWIAENSAMKAQS